MKVIILIALALVLPVSATTTTGQAKTGQQQIKAEEETALFDRHDSLYIIVTYELKNIQDTIKKDSVTYGIPNRP